MAKPNRPAAGLTPIEQVLFSKYTTGYTIFVYCPINYSNRRRSHPMKKTVAVLFALCSYTGFAQRSFNSMYVPPLDVPLSLSANFGEIRANHFHSGIDLKTGGVTGKPVYATADGYVSRIGVSPYGYGLALYIDHPEYGTVSVYGHLERFSDAIQQYVKEQQYQQKSYAVTLYPPAGKFPVKQKELVAYSGNSGSSGGPHLHFEVRFASSQRAVNVLARGMFAVKDDIPPSVISVRLIEVDTVDGVPVHTVRKKYPAQQVARGKYKLAPDTIPIGKPSYFAMEVTDRKNDVGNIFGVHKMELKRGEKPLFGFEIDHFGFDETRYINAFVQYAENNRTRNDIINAYVAPNNKLSVYRNVAGRGVIRPRGITGIETMTLTVHDDAGNSSELVFHIRKSDNPSPEPNAKGLPVFWASTFSSVTADYQVRIPAAALYESLLLNLEPLPAGWKDYSVSLKVHDKNVPLHKAITVRLKPCNLPESLYDKALIVEVDDNGKTSSVGGAWENGWLKSTTTRFGTFRIAVDTVAPRIIARFTSGADLSGQKTVAFTISDDLSGIQAWEVTIDGKWALFEYDAKTATLSHRLDAALIGRGKKHAIHAVVTDERGNRKNYNGIFIW